MRKFHILICLFFCVLWNACASSDHNMLPSPEANKKIIHFKNEFSLTSFCSDLFPEFDSIEALRAVYRFAPVIVQHNKCPDYDASDNCLDKWSRINFITAFDYDYIPGDGSERWKSNNNWDNLLLEENGEFKYRLPATIYYAYLETRTHRFITYFFYHARDQSYKKKSVHTWRMGQHHENDGESVQIVVRKSGQGDTAEEKVVLMATQAHLDTNISMPGDGSVTRKNNIITFYKQRPVVFLEAGKHGIYCSKDYNTPWYKKKFIMEFEDTKTNLKFYPVDYGVDNSEKVVRDNAGSNMEETDSSGLCDGNYTNWWESGVYDYRYSLKSIYTTLWRSYCNNSHLGEDGIVNGAFTVSISNKDREFEIYKVPRHFSSDMISIKLSNKKNSGIIPFALDFRLSDTKGRLFFDPASGYKKEFKGIEKTEWSTYYIYHPYIKSEYWQRKKPGV